MATVVVVFRLGAAATAAAYGWFTFSDGGRAFGMKGCAAVESRVSLGVCIWGGFCFRGWAFLMYMVWPSLRSRHL